MRDVNLAAADAPSHKAEAQEGLVRPRSRDPALLAPAVAIQQLRSALLSSSGCKKGCRVPNSLLTKLDK
jgi:hypothetical protein